MKTNAQTGENQSLRRCYARYSSRRLCFSWLATLLLAASGTATPATVHVDVGQMVFVPYSVTIQPGDTVEWTWTTGHTSSVTSGVDGVPNGLFDSGIRLRPYTFSYTFQSVGRFDYFCRVLPDMMIGRVDVVESTLTPATLANISTRLRVETGENVLIGGYIVTGMQPKKVIMRAIGPSLTLLGVPGALADPTLELHGPSGAVIATNDNWNDNPNRQEIIDSQLAPTNEKESAILMTLSPGSYTVIVHGVNDTTGVALVEAYDLDRTVDSKLANISTRGLVQTGDNVMIGGTIIVGSSTTRVIIRAIGPSLTNFGVANALQDPILELHDGNGALIAANDNWRSDQEAEIIATNLVPTNDAESAIVRTLSPGGYTAIVRGRNGTSGVGLVEAYQLGN